MIRHLIIILTILCASPALARDFPPITFTGLALGSADATAKYHLEKGATEASITNDGRGSFVVRVMYPVPDGHHRRHVTRRCL